MDSINQIIKSFDIDSKEYKVINRWCGTFYGAILGYIFHHRINKIPINNTTKWFLDDPILSQFINLIKSLTICSWDFESFYKTRGFLNNYNNTGIIELSDSYKILAQNITEKNPEDFQLFTPEFLPRSIIAALTDEPLEVSLNHTMITHTTFEAQYTSFFISNILDHTIKNGIEESYDDIIESYLGVGEELKNQRIKDIDEKLQTDISQAEKYKLENLKTRIEKTYESIKNLIPVIDHDTKNFEIYISKSFIKSDSCYSMVSSIGLILHHFMHVEKSKIIEDLNFIDIMTKIDKTDGINNIYNLTISGSLLGSYLGYLDLPISQFLTNDIHKMINTFVMKLLLQSRN
jgi:hypothetical protein